MSREDQVTQTFVDIADSLIDDFDLVDLMVLLTERCVELTEAAAAGLVLIDAQGTMRLVAATSDAVEHVELFQIQNSEGPCRDACITGDAVVVDDLEAETARWPAFVPVAVAAGYRSVYAYPLRVRDRTLGALGAFRSSNVPPSGIEIKLTRALAHVSTVALMQSRALDDAERLTTQLQRALDSRVVIEQAKGVIAEQAQVDMDEAFGRLRHYARTRGLLLTDVANDVVHARLRADTLDR